MEKSYKVKPAYETTVRKLSGHQLRSEEIVFVEGSNLHNELVLYNVLDLFCEEVKVEQWVEPGVKTESWGAYTSANGNIKAHLLIRMQSWADYHNKLDGFVADWGTDRQYKWGIDINRKLISTDFSNTFNTFLFQISVGSEDRSDEMLKYFRKDIQSLIDKI